MPPDMILSCVKNMNGRLFLTALLIQAAILSFSKPACGQTYTSPFEITLNPQIATWTSDFANRQAAIDPSSSPAPADWYSTAYPSPSWGPSNPQLYSVGSLSGAGAAAATELKFDRGKEVYNVGLNTAPGGVDETTWMRQRLMFAAQQLIGTHYQHLHLPTFDPAQVNVPSYTFPWQAVSNNTNLQTTQQLENAALTQTEANPYKAAYGSPQPGIDCTDFAAYIYNLALGVQMHSGTPDQISFIDGAGSPVALGPGAIPKSTLVSASGAVMTPEFLTSPNFGTSTPNAAGSLDGVVSQLQPGDLLYMHGNGSILHVVVWLGAFGTNADGSPSDVPLVISSHDNTPAIFDTQSINADGYPLDGNIAAHLPPPGVQILPFTSENWFYTNFSVAMQIVPVPEPSAFAMILSGLVLTGFFGMRGARRRQRCWLSLDK